MTMRERVKGWLLGEEIRMVRLGVAQVQSLAAEMAELMRQQAKMAADVAKVRLQAELLVALHEKLAYQVKLSKDLQAEMLSEVRGSWAESVKELREELGRIGGGVERSEALLAPVIAMKNQRNARAVVVTPDWDQVQVRNLEQFVEVK